MKYNKVLTLTARLLSRLFGPYSVVPIALWYLLVFHGRLSEGSQLPVAIVLGLFTIVIPLATILLFMQWGKISDIDVTDRRERPLLFSIVTILAWAGYFVSTLFDPGKFYLVISGLALVSTTVATMLTFKEKVSFHMLGMGVLYCLVLLTLGRHWWGVGLIVPLVAWARWYLKKHTIHQIVIGFAIPCLIFLTGALLMLE